MSQLGYAHLHKSLGLSAFEPDRPARTASVTRVTPSGDAVLIPAHVAPQSDDVLAHLLFALKHEGVNLQILSQALRKIPAASMVEAIRAAPSGVGLPALLAAAALGFLAWNFPPAKIFMGDAGSGFLGLMLGAFSLQAAVARPVLLWCWLVLLGVFIVDATFTLTRRLLNRERIYEAHRSHAYQHASREFGAHRPVTIAVAAINVLWLLPWAAAIATGRVDGVVGLVLAYVPLVVLAVRFRAGV